MPRRPRQFAPDVAYHVIARGNNRQALFRKRADFERYLFFLSSLKTAHPFRLYHYCLMTNHVHLLIQFPSRLSFQKVPQRLALLYAKYFAREYRHTGHVFQDRFKSIAVNDNAYLLECGRYIERNPLKAGMVDDAVSYPWSSHAFYAGARPNPLVTENPLFADLGHDRAACAASYREFVRRDRPYEATMESALFGRNGREPE